MKELHIFRGVPGTGKSTAARDLADRAVKKNQKVVILEEDDFFETPEGYRFDNRYRGHALNYAFVNAMKFVYDGTNDIIIVSACMPRRADVQKYVNALWRTDAPYILHVHDMTVEYGSIHGVPEHSMIGFYRHFEKWKWNE